MKLLRLIAGLALVALLIACNLVTGPDLKAKAKKDVQIARAVSKTLTITPNEGGTTSPSGTVEIKDGIAFDIEASAQPEYVFIGWKQTAGDGNVTFSLVEGSTTKVIATVSGGDATIEPVYEARPVLLYMTPIGNNIAKNASVRLVFNREVDLGSAASPLVTLKKQGVTEVPYTLVTKAGTSTVTVKPTAASLDDYAQYVVTVEDGVAVKASFDEDHYPGVTIVNTVVTSRALVTSSFQTGATFDTLPPYNGSFGLLSAAGSAFYTATPAVTLKHLLALDDSGEGGVATFAVRNGSEAFPEVSSDYREDSDFAWTLGGTTSGNYTVGVIFTDVNGNAMPPTSAVEKSIALDVTAPVIGSFALTSSGAAPGYVATTTVPFTLSASDPLIPSSAILGSGESTDGVTPSDQKSYRISNDNATWTAWKAFSASGSVDLGFARDGLKTAYVQVMDAMGNVSASTSATVTLDQTGPSIAALLTDGTLITDSTAITFDLLASDPGSGADKLNLGTGSQGLATSPYASPIAVPAQLALTLTAGDGKKKVQFVLYDKLGNSAATDVDLVLDTTPPSVGSNAFTTVATGTSSATVNLGASDAGSGLFQVGWIADESSAVPSVAGANWEAYQPSISVNLNPSATLNVQHLHLWFKDGAGNISDPTEATIVYNTTPPTASVSVGATTIRTNSVTVTWSASAAAGSLSGISLSNNGSTWVSQSISAAPTLNGTPTWNLVLGGGGSTTNGARNVWIKATDDTGHSTINSVSYTFDNIAPAVNTLVLAGTGGSTSTNSTTVAVSFTLTDNITPVGSIVYEISDDAAFAHKSTVTASTSSINTNFVFANTTNENKVIYVRATDLAGNVSAVKQSAAIKFDTVAPTWSSTPSLDGGALYTKTGVVNVTGISATDGTGSGVVQMRLSNNNSTWTTWSTYNSSYASWNLISGNGGNATVGSKWVYIQVIDAAGNIQTTSTHDGITFDNVAPTAGAPTAAATSVGTRVVTVTNNTVTDVGGSSVVSMRYGVGSVTTNWIPYASTIKVLLTPQNGSKTVSVYYKDGAGNESTAYTITFTLTELWINLTGRDEMVWANYNAPTGSPVYPTPGVSEEDTSWLLSAGPFVLDSTYSSTNRSLIFKTNLDQIGKLKYSLATLPLSFTVYFQTFSSSNPTGPTVFSAVLPGTVAFASGSKVWVDFDATVNPFSASQVVGSSDAYFYNNGGTKVDFYPVSPAKFALF